MKIRVLKESEPLPTEDAELVSLFGSSRAPGRLDDPPHVFCQTCPQHFVVGPDFALVPTIPAGWGEVDHEGPGGLAGKRFEYYCPKDVGWLGFFRGVTPS